MIFFDLPAEDSLVLQTFNQEKFDKSYKPFYKNDS